MRMTLLPSLDVVAEIKVGAPVSGAPMIELLVTEVLLRDAASFSPAS